MGQRLVRLAADDLQLEVQRRHVAVLRAQRDLERLSSNDQKVPGDRTDRELRQAELTLAVTEKAAAVRRLNARDLRAPFAGRVLQIPVAEGQLMAPGGGGVYVVEPESLFLEIEGDEFEIRGLRPDIEGVAFLEGVVSASLKIRVRTSPALKRLRVGSGAPALFSVEADILSSGSAELQPGLTAHVDLLIRDAVVPVAVPLRYVEFRNRSASIIVCSQAGPPEEREVTLGGTDSQFAEIRTNLTVGERVLMRRKS